MNSYIFREWQLAFLKLCILLFSVLFFEILQNFLSKGLHKIRIVRHADSVFDIHNILLFIKYSAFNKNRGCSCSKCDHKSLNH